MARGATVKQEDEPGPAGEPKASKRRCVQSACVPCRKRKSKCDGSTPVCATCTAVYKTPCFYDADSESRRIKTPAKRDSSVVSTASSSEHAEFLLNALRSLPEPDAHELLQHIRRDARVDTAALAESWRKTATLPATPIEPQSLERDLSMLLGKPAMTRSGESRYFGHTSALSLVTEDENYMRDPVPAASAERKERPNTWTSVTQDMAFVERLLDLYFRWSHPFYVIFSRECFYKDFRSRREKYCSALLVNAILSYACHFTDDPAGRTDPDNPRTAGDHFFDEARRLLFEDENPSLITTQALCVMAMREPSAGRDSSGFMYMGRCMRMAIELGLHLNNSAAPGLQLTPSEVEVRKVTFWGCFTVDTVWSICVGRISQLPRAAITLDKPILDEAPFNLQPDAFSGTQPPPGIVTSCMFLQEFSTLSELINDNNYMFFAPKERFTSRRLLECYAKYQHWYKNLPQQLKLEDAREPQPHIIVLHMLYHTAVVHLFRPMLKVDLIHSNVSPRNTCVDAANQVANLLRLYRQHFNMRACQLVLTHVLLSVCIVHLLYSSESPVSYRNLVEGMQALDDMSVCHYFGGRSFKIVHALSQVWNIPFPKELNGSKLLSKDSASPSDPLLLQPTTSIASRLGGGVGYSPVPLEQASRRESLSMFARPDRKSVPLPSHTATSQSSSVASSQAQHQHSQPKLLSAYSLSPSTVTASTPQSIPTSAPTPPSSGSAETLFWAPLPGMGVPILPRNYQMSPMDLDNMLGNVNEWDRFSRDGFKMSDTWQQDPVSSYNGDHSGGFSQAGQSNGYHASADAAQYGDGGDVHQHGVQHGPGQPFDPAWWGGEASTGPLS
ncbi:hypothetical protein K458DRAFT_355200 [Lentithecium fluviatile CBS 122367]|uniref:Zn(2)-C6 fungal-type domain-containing protein n=1 Tax=Lentithecium fluviatile CBS 122367 TaxID=1168545 RepID=A0A6G1JJZ5_9PLEO|nr:hypothetical protein K458DRAFT_355200 [Lentithecium fluviatile CBS 122367]